MFPAIVSAPAGRGQRKGGLRLGHRHIGDLLGERRIAFAVITVICSVVTCDDESATVVGLPLEAALMSDAVAL